ncbi:hypothetical protein ACFY05_32990 [Microtetraspora fusca]|uniref:Uncharacterized protein n=1 Tax=Microtetraspora fusca TaxID=1997 RepID=A0ABW6VEJ5_MICFU
MFNKRNETEPWPEGVVARCITAGATTVDVYETTFKTGYDAHGKWLGGERREVDGFNWRCLGCNEVGKADESYYIGKGYRDQREAKNEAQTHANGCSFLPRPSA